MTKTHNPRGLVVFYQSKKKQTRFPEFAADKAKKLASLERNQSSLFYGKQTRKMINIKHQKRARTNKAMREYKIHGHCVIFIARTHEITGNHDTGHSVHTISLTFIIPVRWNPSEGMEPL